MTKQKQPSKTMTLPKTLWGFYFKHAIHGNGWMILAGAILSFVVAFDRVLQPLIQSWTVAELLEELRPAIEIIPDNHIKLRMMGGTYGSA
ncbi:MAG: hypothetical protein IJX89_03650 [Alphaproteobacteria bacterium]|nr:hypothetical protein [Alphaproteobacteria bacterium]